MGKIVSGDLIKDWKRMQEKLAKAVILRDCFKSIDVVAGVDCAFYKDWTIATYVSNRESIFSITKTTAPYIPTFLSFRELPPILSLFSKIRSPPDLIFVDGQGIAHPRYCGLATHLGVTIGIPTIGVAKSKLYGDVVGDKIMDGKKQIGWFIPEKKIFISPGNKVSLKSALELTLKFIGKKQPKVLEEADRLSKKVRNLLKEGGKIL